MAKQIKIGNYQIGDDLPCFIIAELGINHNGDINIAKKLIDIACDAGVNAIKLQKRTIDVVYSEADRNKPREIPKDVLENALSRNALPVEALSRLKASKVNMTNGDQKYCLELGQKEFEEIDRYCKEKEILWFASPWDEEAVAFLEKFKRPMYKLSSASLTDGNLLKRVKDTGRPIMLSTGMSTIEEVQAAVSFLGSENILIAQSTSTYPCAVEELNLRVIQTYQELFPNIPIGYSGHETGLAPTLAAVALGASFIERHITIDRAMWGTDQAASVEIVGLQRLVKDIRDIEKALGDGIKKVYESESGNLQKLRRVKSRTETK